VRSGTAPPTKHVTCTVRELSCCSASSSRAS